MRTRKSSVFRRSQPAADADEQLIDAVNRGDAAAVEAALAAGADPNAIGANGFTALCMAAHDGDLDVARLLLDGGANVNAARPESGYTALHFAAERGHVGVARLLLDRGADVGAATYEDDRDRYSIFCAQPLHLAALGKREAVVKLLLARGADVRATATWCAAATGWQRVTGMTPLHCAVMQTADIPVWTLQAAVDAVATARALLDAGAPIDAADSEGWRPLHLAVWYSDNNLTGVVVRGALYANGAGVARILLHSGADARAADANGRTPLHVACDPPGRLVPLVIEALLAHGADARAADKSGQQPLHYLAAHQPRRKNGDSQGSTAEECAEAESEARDVERIVGALVEHGADVGAANDEGCTPLILAVATRNAPACAALARRGPLVSQCSRCVAAAKLSADAQAAVVGMAGEAAQLRRQQAALEEERAALEQERAAWQRERTALARERAAWRKERAAIEAARGSGGGGGGGGGGGADQQQEEEGQPAAKRKRGSAGAARRRR